MRTKECLVNQPPRLLIANCNDTFSPDLNGSLQWSGVSSSAQVDHKGWFCLRHNEFVSTMLDRLGLGYVVLDERKNLISWNSEAKIALSITGEPKDLLKALSFAFRQLIADMHCELFAGTLCWIVIPHRGALPVVVHEERYNLPNGQSVVFPLGRDTGRKPNGFRLQRLFGLTGAETELALSIACGKTLLDIAQSRNLSRATIGSQLAFLFAKTDARRQSDLLAFRQNVIPPMNAVPELRRRGTEV